MPMTPAAEMLLYSQTLRWHDTIHTAIDAVAAFAADSFKCCHCSLIFDTPPAIDALLYARLPLYRWRC